MYVNNTTIKSWAEEDRPREKLQNMGRAQLTNAELLAIVLGSGTRKKSAVELAKEILTENKDCLYKLGTMSQVDLMKFSGVGDAKALSIIAVMELGRRRAVADIPLDKKINEAKDIYDLIKPDFQDLDHEIFKIIGLSRSNRLIGKKLISKGGRSGTLADGKLIFKELIDMKASSCVLVHNHPSGRLIPSSQDLELTKRLAEFGKLIDLPILDHLIVADTGYYSFVENGRMS
ncbi:RadC family protein [Brumimicrobium mesophilum]|uniref:RadC family protein n=1 Tax=Brumimicrobium mesophilum TaxID=392717 RepID=UPI000D144076|nr:DNA repair protein RadC [Brumimicrobium mesophilum]